MPHRTRAELSRDKAKKLVQNLFDEFKDPIRPLTVYGGYLLQLNGPPYFDDNDLTRLQVKLLPFDVSDTAIPNSAPSFFKPWPSGSLSAAFHHAERAPRVTSSLTAESPTIRSFKPPLVSI
jgi:hypothetical protein